jgi:broad specificity phosphatase PhoE
VTTLYLVRHGATAANLARPPVLQGRRDLPLAVEGVRQAEAARDALAGVALAACYTSPLLRAAQTAQIIAAPHGLAPQVLEALAECDVGAWEGLSWEEIRRRDPVARARFRADPWNCPYAGGESLRQVAERAGPVLERLLEVHADGAALVVTHQVLLRACLVALAGHEPARARELRLGNGEIVVLQRHEKSRCVTLSREVPPLRRLSP